MGTGLIAAASTALRNELRKATCRQATRPCLLNNPQRPSPSSQTKPARDASPVVPLTVQASAAALGDTRLLAVVEPLPEQGACAARRVRGGEECGS